jgi:hypothetical protein
MSPDPGVFLCCAGKGLYLGAKDLVVQCDLRQRTARTLKLYWEILSVAQRYEIPFANTEFDKIWLRPAVQKLILQTSEGSAGSGKPVGVVQGFLSALSLNQSHRDAKLIVVDHIGKLWLPDQQLQFDLLVSYLYQSSLPFWLNFSSAEKHMPLNSRATVSQRVEALKQGKWEKFMTAQSLARLRLMVGCPTGALPIIT